MAIEVIDLFCGVGGLSSGFKREGFKVVAGFDLDATCKFAFEKNIEAKFFAEDIASISEHRLIGLYSVEALRILVGCAPCQPFSIYAGKYRQDDDDTAVDNRWALLNEFARLIELSNPHIVSMENVLRVKLHPAFSRFVDRLKKAGYFVSWHKIRAQDYGVPQKRHRLVLFASKFGEVNFTEPTHRDCPVTVREAIASLPAIVPGQPNQVDPLHTSRGLSDRNLNRLKATKAGGSWRDWSESLKLSCHKKPSGKSFRAVYGRMNWDEPSPVITTQCLGIGNGRFGHPDQDRAISIREAATLQSFPKDFELLPKGAKVNGLQLARQIGNAVPPLLANAVARSIREHLQTATLR